MKSLFQLHNVQIAHLFASQAMNTAEMVMAAVTCITSTVVKTGKSLVVVNMVTMSANAMMRRTFMR